MDSSSAAGMESATVTAVTESETSGTTQPRTVVVAEIHQPHELPHPAQPGNAIVAGERIPAPQQGHHLVERNIDVDLPEYTVVCSIGRGSFGIVWKGQHKENIADFVAIKQIERRHLREKYSDREIEFARDLKKKKHKNVVEFISVVTKPHFVYLVQQLCDRDLNELFRKSGQVWFKHCVRYMNDMATGTQHLHSLGICHRDLKPSNILEKEGVMKVADLGLACKIPETSGTSIIATEGIGSFGWQAPEVPLKDHTSYNLGVDIFSLALIFLSMLRHEIGKSLEPHMGKCSCFTLLCSHYCAHANSMQCKCNAL